MKYLKLWAKLSLSFFYVIQSAEKNKQKNLTNTVNIDFMLIKFILLRSQRYLFALYLTVQWPDQLVDTKINIVRRHRGVCKYLSNCFHPH